MQLHVPPFVFNIHILGTRAVRGHRTNTSYNGFLGAMQMSCSSVRLGACQNLLINHYGIYSFLHMHINDYHGNRNCSANDNFCLKIFCPQKHLKIILMSKVVL